MRNSALKQTREEYTPLQVAPAVGLAEKDQRTLIAIIEGYLGKNIRSANYEGAEPDGISLYIFDPSSQQLCKVSYENWKNALDASLDDINENARDLRKLISQGPNLDILVNSNGGLYCTLKPIQRLIEQTSNPGGKTSSYAFAQAMSTAGLIWGIPDTRYVLPETILLWHKASLRGNQIDSEIIKGTRAVVDGRNNSSEVKELIQQSLDVLQKFHEFVYSQFLRAISSAPLIRHEELIKTFLSGKNVSIRGSEAAEWGLATQYEDLETMKRFLFRSIRIEPYTSLGPLEEFFLTSIKDYEKLNGLTSKEEAVPQPKRYIPQPIKQQTQDCKGRNNLLSKRIKQGLPLATLFSVLFGISYFGFLAYKENEKLEAEWQPVFEKFCSDSYPVSLNTGPKTFEYNIDGRREEVTIGNDMLRRKHVRINSIHLDKICLLEYAQ